MLIKHYNRNLNIILYLILRLLCIYVLVDYNNIIVFKMIDIKKFKKNLYQNIFKIQHIYI